jgi:hypothetical protein
VPSPILLSDLQPTILAVERGNIVPLQAHFLPTLERNRFQPHLLITPEQAILSLAPPAIPVPLSESQFIPPAHYSPSLMIPLPPSDQLSHSSGLSYVSSQRSRLLSEKAPTDVSQQSSEKSSEKVSISVRQALNPQLAELGEPLMIEPEHEDLITEVPINFPTCQPTHIFSINKEEGEKSPF